MVERAPDCRCVWRLFVKGWSIHALANEWDCHESNIEEALRRADKRLRQSPRPRWRKWR